MKRTILIIGAGKGLGNGVAEKFGQHDFRVILVARNQEHLKNYAENFQQRGIETITQKADVADFNGLTAAMHELVKSYGMPDVVFYNVGITQPDSECLIDAQTMVDRYTVDVAGAYHAIQLFDTKEFADKQGTFLITGGGFGIQPYAGYLPLSMDKAALRAMVLALAPGYREKGIFLGIVEIMSSIGSNYHYAPSSIANAFWELYIQRDKTEILY